jgi:hypothetical protein
MVRHNLEYPKDVHNTVKRYKHQDRAPPLLAPLKVNNLAAVYVLTIILKSKKSKYAMIW